MKDVLAFENVSFTYEDHAGEILHELNFSIQTGEFVSIIGPSGSGKSTLFRLITGLEQQDKGSILLNGHELNNRLGHVGYMAQKDGLLPWLTIMENALLPIKLKGSVTGEMKMEVASKLQAFGLEGFEQAYPDQLSGGMRQRVSFLRALLSGSSILLLDEPFSALDAVTKSLMQEWLLKQWKETGKTILFITHDVEEALFLSDRILIFGERPVQELVELEVPLPRPRTVQVLKDPVFTKLKENILLDLRNKVTI